MQRRWRRWTLWVSASVFVACLAGCTSTADGGGSDQSGQNGPASSRGLSPSVYDDLVFTYDEDEIIATEAIEVLAVESLANPAISLTQASAEALGGESLLPEGANLSVDLETWQRQGRLAVVQVEVSLVEAPEPDRFLAWLVETSDGWRLSHTEAIEATG